MVVRRHKLAPRCRAVVLWAVFGYFAGQAGLSTTMSTSRPDLRDPEYGHKLRNLRTRLKQKGSRQPHVLVLGSSRVAVGFRPGDLRVNQGRYEHTPVVFNFGMCYAGPFLELICLRRLLADGIRPNHIFVEVWPLLASTEELNDGPGSSLDLLRMGWRDVRVFDRYGGRSWSRYERWYEAQLSAWWTYRFFIMNRHFPTLIPPATERTLSWQNQDGWGWLDIPQFRIALDEVHYRHEMTRNWQQSAGRLAHLEITDVSRRALSEFVSLCHRNDIHVALLLMPEAEEFRSWYSVESLAHVDRFLRTMQSDQGVAVVDCRDWCRDALFVEGIHLCHEGAMHFTRRFEREVLEPLFGSDGCRALERE